MESNVISPVPVRAPGRPLDASRQPPAVASTWQAMLGSPPLAAAVASELQTVSKLHKFSAGATVFSHEDAARELFVLVRGEAALGRALPAHPFQTERSVRGPAWLDASSAWLGQKHLQDAVAQSDCQVLSIPRSALQTLLVRHPDLAPRIFSSQAGQVQTLVEVIHDLMHKDAEGRFAAWLLHRCGSEAEGAAELQVTLQERKRDIAAQLAITPETLSRLLRQLKRKGLIDVMGYTVKVLDMPALRALALD